MDSRAPIELVLVTLLTGFSTLAVAQAFRVQCPTITSLHPTVGTGSPTGQGAPYNGPVTLHDTGAGGASLTYLSNRGWMKDEHDSIGGRLLTIADSSQIYMLHF